jgi:Raf kinase inhibitor-like YbhB/YbcL family protein
MTMLPRPFLLVALIACKSGPQGPGPSPPPGVSEASLTVTSKAFSPNGTIPVDYSCDGASKSPPLTWSSPPEGTKSLAIVVEDPDAPGETYTHWVVFDLPADMRTIAEAVDPATLNARVAVNDAKNARYDGPCPPKRELHRYYFRVFALDGEIAAPDGADKQTVFTAMSQHVLAEGALIGLFSH